MGVHAALTPESGPLELEPTLRAAVVSALPVEELDRLIGPERVPKVAALSDWLIRTARKHELPVEVIAELCDRLVALGLPLDRFNSSMQTLDAEFDAVARLWIRGEPVRESTYVRTDEGERYRHSPYFAAAESRQWVELRLDETDDSAFEIVAELKALGVTHYLCVPMFLMNGTNAWVTLGTRAPAGFSTQDIATIARIVPNIAVLMDVRSNWTALQKLLRTYVGDEPHQAILSGNTKRGQVSTIKSAMLFADMRDSVGHTAALSATEAVEMFNSFFDCLVPATERRHGEVLKYIGDGLLAIFREHPDTTCCDAAPRALAAAEEALRTLHERNLAHPHEPPIEVGIALHYGEAAYGNVGSGVRLDFTVIGQDVNLASRIANMNRGLGEPLLMSKAFVDRLQQEAAHLGAYPARGFASPLDVYRPLATPVPEPA